MRKSLLLTAMFLLFSFMGFSQEWHGITSDSPVRMKKTLVSSTENEIVVNVNLDGFYTSNVKTPNGKQVVVSVDKMVSMLEAGAPDLPMQDIPVIIGDMAEMTVNVVESTYVDYENVEVAPSKGNFSRQINPDDVPYTYGEMYSQDAFWPATQAYLEAPYILRDFRGQNIMVRPFAYNPVTKTLRVYTSMTIAMTKVSDNGENQKATRKSSTIKVSPEYKNTYNHRFINFGETGEKYTFIDDAGSMVVIAADQYAEAMQPLVDWKNISGRPCTLVTISEIGGNTDTQIKEYISNLYDGGNGDIAYILLVGDLADVASHSMNGGRSDNWYAMLDGSDYYCEAFVGRFSCNSVADAENQVAKVLYYERDMPEGLTWLNKGVGIGANEGSGSGHMGGEADYVHINYVRDTLLHYTYEAVSQQYSGVGGGTSAAAISADLNAGASIVNYCNHGSQTSWAVANYSNSNVNALTNDYMWPYIISVACNNGQFDGTCFGEAWLRATNSSTGAPTGALGGMFSWISQPWQPPMTGQDEMIDILTEWINPDSFRHTIGAMAENGNMKILDAHASDAGNTHNTWINFADPSTMMRTDNPTDMDVTITPAAPMVGMSSLTVNAEANFGIATLSDEEGEVLASAYISDGAAELSFEPFSTVGTFTLVVIGYNRVTYVGDIEVLPAEGAYVAVDAFTPGNVPVNEEQFMSMTFKNVGVDPTEGETTVVLSSEDENITFSDNEASFGILAADETITLTDAFAFTVATGVADGTKIQIDVTSTCGSNVWGGKAKITVGAPIIEFVNFQSPGGYEAGQTMTVAANFQNVGHYMATNAVVTASSSSDYVTFETETAEIGTIDPDGVVTAIFTLTIDEACPTTEVLPLEFNLVADNEATAIGEGVLKNSCVLVFNLSDSYGDGWNNAKLLVSFNDGTPTQQLTFTSGSSFTTTMEVGVGVHVTLGWSTGSYDSECSFTLSYEGGEQITSATSLSSSYHFEFDVNCAGDPVTADPVQNLAATVETNDVILTWDAPATGTPVSYLINRNGVEIANVTELTYLDEDLEWETTYNYTVVAQYDGGNSLPVAVTAIIGTDSVEEGEANFGIYPNPAETMVNIITSASNYEYQLINSVGQVVVSGNGDGNAQISVSELENGVYFLKVVANGNANIQKVVIK